MSGNQLPRALTLYKRILRLHQKLPVDLKEVGDKYVKSEFRLHKSSSPEIARHFLHQWKVYADELDGQVYEQEVIGDNTSTFGSNLTVESLEELSSDQIVQLHELMTVTKKNSE